MTVKAVLPTSGSGIGHKFTTSSALGWENGSRMRASDMGWNYKGLEAQVLCFLICCGVMAKTFGTTILKRSGVSSMERYLGCSGFEAPPHDDFGFRRYLATEQRFSETNPDAPIGTFWNTIESWRALCEFIEQINADRLEF